MRNVLLHHDGWTQPASARLIVLFVGFFYMKPQSKVLPMIAMVEGGLPLNYGGKLANLQSITGFFLPLKMFTDFEF